MTLITPSAMRHIIATLTVIILMDTIPLDTKILIIHTVIIIMMDFIILIHIMADIMEIAIMDIMEIIMVITTTIIRL